MFWMSAGVGGLRCGCGVDCESLQTKYGSSIFNFGTILDKISNFIAAKIVNKIHLGL